MKRRFTILTAALALLAFLAVPMGMMGQTRTAVTWTASEQGYTNGESLDGVSIELDDYITIQFDKNDGNNAPAYYNTGTAARLYPKNSLTVTPASGYQITGMTLTFSGTGNTGTLGASVGSYSLSSATGTWSGSSTSAVVLTNNATSGHARMQVLTVTYSEAGSTPPTPTTYTVTYDCNGGTTGCPENVTGIEAGEEITLADAPTKDGFDFAGWNDGNNTYDAGDEYNVNGNVTFTAQWTEVVSGDVHWVLTDLADLTANDVFVIVGNNGSNYAMTNNNGTGSAPATTAVTIAGNEITSTVIANIQWNVSGNSTDGYTFYPNGSTTTWLYCNTEAPTSSNNNMRVGTGNRKVFELNSNNYLMTKDDYVVRYLSIYNDADWRGYINTNLCPAMSFYKKVTGEVLPPSITANNVNIAYDATSGEIAYTLNNPVADGTLSVSEDVDWISNAVLSTTENKVTFEATANEATTAREGIITITYTYGDNETVSKEVTVIQAAAPVIYTTIPDLFAAATGTETPVLVTFNNWVVSGVSSNGKNIFVTDNNGNGFVIYFSSDMSSTFAAGDILSGTAVSCNLKKYNGFAELLNVTATDLTITSGGTVAVADVAMANLAGVNTGALLHYDNLTCVVTTNSAGTATYYNLTDGATTMQVYSAIYAFGTLVEGKTYNITGIYQQYNNTKEILPRSAEDIEEVEVQHEEYTLTVSDLSHVNLFIFGGEDSETIISTEDGETTAQVYDGTQVLVSIDVEAGYVFQSLTITDGNGDPVVTEELTPNEYYSFLMPTSNVTITATAEALTGDNYELFNGALVEGDYLIVYNGKAMNNTVSSNRLQYAEVTAYNDVITTDNAEIVWHIAPSGDYWTIYSADAEAYAASTGTKNQATTMTDGTDDKALWMVSGNYDFVNKYNADNSVNSYLRNNGTYGFACYATGTGGTLSLYKKVEAVTETHTLTINGYEAGSNGGYCLIASPVTVDPSSVGMTIGDYDLYYFDQAEENEWQNYKDNDGTGHFNLVPGKGYLYAKQATTEGEVFNFTLTGTPYDGNGEVTLHKTDGVDWSGWNLVGNPFDTTAYIDIVSEERPFYTMNGDGNAFEACTNTSIDAKEGIFVVAENEGEIITFTTIQPTQNGKGLVLNLNDGRKAIDRAIVRFNKGRQLPKLQFRKGSTMVYIPVEGKDYAVVRAEEMGEMPVNFKAENNGTYNLSLSSDNVEFVYLHLIDNLTGNDVDMLQTPSYSFEAKTTDYTNRFKLIFATGNNSNEDNFAFFSNGSFVINNEGNATLQVVDVTGRILKSESITGCANVNVNATPGVYMLRLVNGDNVKVQKVVVR